MSTMYQAGFEGKLYIGTTLVAKIVDVDPTFTREEIEVTSRDSEGWKEFMSGLGEWACDFQIVYVHDAAGLSLLEASFTGRTEIAEFKMLDKNGRGWKGSVIVTNFSRKEPLGDRMQYEVTVRGTGELTKVAPS